MSALGYGMAALALACAALGGFHVVLAWSCARDRLWALSAFASIGGTAGLGLTAMTSWAALTEGIWKL